MFRLKLKLKYNWDSLKFGSLRQIMLETLQFRNYQILSWFAESSLILWLILWDNAQTVAIAIKAQSQTVIQVLNGDYRFMILAKKYLYWDAHK